ncbi:MAG: hypothetical protein ACK4UN_15225 [Limisphaerales bacterium]
MKLTPRAKPLIFGYTLILLGMLRSLAQQQFDLSLLDPVAMVGFAFSLFFLPWFFRIPAVYPLIGGLSVVGMIGLIVAVLALPKEPVPWLLYLTALCLFAGGTYIFLIDKEVKHYAANLREKVARGPLGQR